MPFDLRINFGTEPATRAPQRFVLLQPWAMAMQGCAVGESEQPGEHTLPDAIRGSDAETAVNADLLAKPFRSVTLGRVGADCSGMPLTIGDVG